MRIDPPSTTPRRADAERNRERILAAAQAAFAEPDADVSMIELARRAGVGSATLYRNFASRRELLEALYEGEIDTLCQAAVPRVDVTPGVALREWLRGFYAYFSSKRVIAGELLEHADRDDPVFSSGYARVMDAGRPLVQGAHDSGELRADLRLEQLLDMVAAIAKVPGDSQYRDPMLDAVLDIMRSQAATQKPAASAARIAP